MTAVLAASDADAVASRYGPGRRAGPMVPVARGELGRIRRLPYPPISTDTGISGPARGSEL
jgi:hypothetical protein